MNKKLMALSLVISLGFSQVPMQAEFLSRRMLTSKIETLYDIAKQHPVYSLITVGALLGVSYLANNRNRIGNYIKNTIQKRGHDFNAFARLDVHEWYNRFQALDHEFLQEIRDFLNDNNSAWTKTFQSDYESTLHTLIAVTKNEGRDKVEIEVETWKGIARSKAERVEEEFKLSDYSNRADFNDAIVKHIQQTLCKPIIVTIT